MKIKNAIVVKINKVYADTGYSFTFQAWMLEYNDLGLKTITTLEFEWSHPVGYILDAVRKYKKEASDKGFDFRRIGDLP